ncbi:ABC transporter permease [Lentzea sp. E54]|uniref:ABC transporter permease n=1 Tax=Lentzea xerophila TaxID=3435883 RepID=UPI003DA50D33
MTWIVWRQQRPMFITLAVALAVTVAVILVWRAGMIADISARNLLDCVRGEADICRGTAVVNEFQNAWFMRLHVTQGLVLVVPALLGVFVGAPLFAREFEQGTHALAFTQSVSRTRWMATKFLVAAVPVLLFVGVFQVVVHSWLDAAGKLGPLGTGPFYFTTFDSQGVSPIAYTLFAYTLGMATGALFKRTLVAMTVTLGVFVAVRAALGAVRESMITPTRLLSDDVATPGGFVERGGPLVLESGFLDPQGAVVADPGSLMSCPSNGQKVTDADLAACYRKNGLAQSYADVIPVDQATTLHLLEGAIFAGLTVLLVLGSVWAVRRQV